MLLHIVLLLYYNVIFSFLLHQSFLFSYLFLLLFLCANMYHTDLLSQLKEVRELSNDAITKLMKQYPDEGKYNI